MRRFLAMAVLLLLSCSALAEAVPGNQLGLNLLAKLSDGKSNQLISPVSLGYALSMAAAGAEGDTREKLLKALEADSPEAIADYTVPLNAAGLRVANAVFLRDGLLMKDGFAKALEERFEAERFGPDGLDAVNEWTRTHTDGLIDGLLNHAPVSDVELMLVNAVAMDCEWASPFDPSDSWMGTFHAPDGEVRAKFMHQTTYMQYGENGGTQFVRKAYIGGLSMRVALPPKGRLADALSGLKRKGLDYFQYGAYPREVALSLPKLDIEVNLALAEPLKDKDMGLKLIFEDEADFSQLSKSPLKVSEVRQRARLQVDEAGTRAAAVTSVDMAAGAAPIEGPKPVTMDVNRPFLLVIADEASGAILFAAAVAQP